MGEESGGRRTRRASRRGEVSCKCSFYYNHVALQPLISRQAMTHGWTQMPVSWLKAEEKRTREEIFEKTVTFTKSVWKGEF